MKKIISIFAAFLFLAAAAGPLFSFEERRTLGNKPSKICKDIIDAINKKDYSKLNEITMEPVSEACDEIQKRFSIDLKAELSAKLKKGDYEGMKQSAIKFIYYDMKNIFTMVQSQDLSDVAVAMEMLKLAYTDYFAVSQDVQNSDMVTDWKFKKMFTSMFSALSTSGYTEKTVVMDNGTRASVKSISDKIELTLAEVFPAVKS